MNYARNSKSKSDLLGLQVSCCFYPEIQRKVLYGDLRRYLGAVFHELASHKGCEILEGHLKPDHVHMCIRIPPFYAVSQVVGYLKGKSAIWIARNFSGRHRNFVGENFWARGYYVSTVGIDETVVRNDIKNKNPLMHITSKWDLQTFNTLAKSGLLGYTPLRGSFNTTALSGLLVKPLWGAHINKPPALRVVI